jgi:hypothetical protein
MAAAGFRDDVRGLVYVEYTDSARLGAVIGSHTLKIRKERGAAYPKSPDGHGWGYGGSAAAQLSMDMLWEVYGAQPDPSLIQQFKAVFVAKLDQESGWTATEAHVRDLVDGLGGWKPAYPEEPVEARSVWSERPR